MKYLCFLLLSALPFILHAQPSVRLYNKGVTLAKKGKIPEAEAYFTRAITRDPYLLESYYNRALTRSMQQKYTEAITDYSTAIAYNPRCAAAYTNRGADKKAIGDTAGAVTDYTCAIAADSNYSMAYFNRGIIRYTQGNFEQALADFTKAATLLPGDVEANHNKRLAWQRIHFREEPLADSILLTKQR